MSNKCPVCTFELNRPSQNTDKGNHSFDCSNCGKFILTSTVEHLLQQNLQENPNKAGIISHFLRKSQNGNNWPLLNSETLKKILEEESYPSPTQQAKNIILWIGENIAAPGEKIEFTAKTHQAIIGAKDSDSVEFIMDYLFKNKLVEGGNIPTLDEIHFVSITLTFDGWAYYEEIIHGKINSKKAFMAMQFNNSTLTKVVDDCFKPAVKDTGFDLQTVLEQPKAGSIDDRIRVEI
jgi:hypothetical protein